MWRLPRNSHVVTTSRSPDNVIREKHAMRHVWSAAPPMQNDDGGLQSAAPGTKTAIHRQKNVGMSKSATLATRNETTRYLERRTHHRHGRTAFTRAPVDGCGRLRTAAGGCATSGQHSRNPQIPEWNGNPCYAFGKIGQHFWLFFAVYIGSVHVFNGNMLCLLKSPFFDLLQAIESVP